MNMIGRRAAIASALSVGLGSGALAQESWPSRPIRLVVGYPAGGPGDLITRLAADGLRDELNVPVIVENRPGAGGAIGAAFAARAEPDGYTIFSGHVQNYTLNPLIQRSITYRPLEDFVSLGTLAVVPNVLVVNARSSTLTTVAELVQRARSRPGSLTYASYGPGSSPHLLSVLLQQIGGFEALQVPYAGSAPALAALLAGDVDFMFDNVTTSAAQVRGGAVRALAVAWPERLAVLPNVPTMDQAGVRGFDLQFWFALFAPVRTPEPIIRRLRAALAAAASKATFIERLRAQGGEPFSVPADRLPDFFRLESERWAKLLHDAGVRPE